MTDEPLELNRLLGVREVSDWLHVSQSWVRGHASGKKRPTLPSIKLGGALRFRREAVQAFIDRWSRDVA